MSINAARQNQEMNAVARVAAAAASDAVLVVHAM
jgi:hypothetical protein